MDMTTENQSAGGARRRAVRGAVASTKRGEAPVAPRPDGPVHDHASGPQQSPPPGDSMCSAPTDIGGTCRRIAGDDGLCSYHRRRNRVAAAVDPLELVDWSRSVETLDAVAAAAGEPAPRKGDEVGVTMSESQSEDPASAGQAVVPAASQRARHLKAVPDAGDADGESAEPFEAPDVLAIEHRRARLRAEMPLLSDTQIDKLASTYRSSLASETVRAYESRLTDFYRYAARHGFDPLRCSSVQVEAYLLELVNAHTPDDSGKVLRDRPYSVSYIKQIIAALRRATKARELPDHTEPIDVASIISAHKNDSSSDLPRMAKTEIRAHELMAIERTAREGTNHPMALRRAAVALGCDPDLDLSVTQLCALKFEDIALQGSTAVVAVRSRGSVDAIELRERPGDPACPVAALRGLREAARNRMRAQRGGAAPTDAQIRDGHVFANQRSGAALSRKGLKLIVTSACAAVEDVPPPKRGRLPALSAHQRRQAIASDDPKTARDLTLIFHSAFASARVGNVADFNVEHVEVWGRVGGVSTYTPLVDRVEPDGSITAGILGQIAVITDTDILDETGASLYESGLIMGVQNRFAYGTKTQLYHENWYVVQPGWPCCPVRLLLRWLKAYDGLLAVRGEQLAGHHPLFTSLKRVGEPIRYLSRTLGEVVRAAVSSIGLPPGSYSAHSLRKFRASHVLSRGGSMTEVMVHDGRSSEIEGPVYARRDPQNPFAGDPTVGIFDVVAGEQAEQAAAAGASHQSGAARPGEAGPARPEQSSSPSDAVPVPADAVSDLRLQVERLRGAGLDDRAIAEAALLGLG